MARKSTGFYIGKVEGIGPALEALEQFKPALYDELVAKMKGVADATAMRVNAKMPNDPPMSGFAHGGATGWAKKGEASAKPESSRTTEANIDWPIYKISLGGYASAVTDIAGAGSGGSTMQGQNMTAVLNSRFGRASRWIWPVAQNESRRVSSEMEKACDKIEAKVSAKLAEGAGRTV